MRTLQNAITSGRIAHSYLFTGPRGTGKTSTARLLSKALNCEHGPSAEPDDTCEICRAITAGSCVDVIEMDAASESGVEEIRRQIVESVEYLPMICRYKIYIIDEVHDLSPKAFDALLKTIEEPPSHIIFILATTEYNKVPPTIRSRCQKFEFHRASMQDLISRLSYVIESEKISAEPAALAAIARMADGGYRDALTLLEQAILTAEETITLQQVYDQLGLVSEEVVDAILLAIKDKDVAKIMDLLAQVARLGRDPRAILDSMMYRLSDLTRASYQVSLEAGAEATREAAIYEMASRIGRETILKLRGSLAEAHKAIRDISLPRLWLEAELVRLSQIPDAPAHRAPAHEHPAPRPAPVQAAPAPKPKAAAPDTPAPTPTSPSEPKVVAEPVTSADNSAPVTSATSTDPWGKTVKELTVLSKTLGFKLEGSTDRLIDNRLVIEFDLEINFEWVNERPKVKAAIQEAVHRNFGPNTVVEHTVRRREASRDDTSAVELPAEGSKLEQLARQVFGADPTNQRNGKSPDVGEIDNENPAES